jgi:hypothetical protein
MEQNPWVLGSRAFAPHVLCVMVAAALIAYVARAARFLLLAADRSGLSADPKSIVSTGSIIKSCLAYRWGIGHDLVRNTCASDLSLNPGI